MGDLLAAVRKHGPLTVEIIVVAAGIVAMSVILIDVRQITAGVVLLHGGLFTEVLLVCWKAMRAPWDKLVIDPPKKKSGEHETRGQADT